MRFVTTNCRPLCEDPEGEDRYVVMVSSRLWEAGDCSVMNMFVRPDTAREALDVLNFLRFHIYTGLRYVKVCESGRWDWSVGGVREWRGAREDVVVEEGYEGWWRRMEWRRGGGIYRWYMCTHMGAHMHTCMCSHTHTHTHRGVCVCTYGGWICERAWVQGGGGGGVWMGQDVRREGEYMGR